MTRIFFKYIKKVAFKILKNKVGPTSLSFNLLNLICYDFTLAIKKKTHEMFLTSCIHNRTSGD